MRRVCHPALPFAGRAGAGVGDPHVGQGWIWPMAFTMQALTSDDEAEIAGCLATLKRSHAGTGFLHETFWKDDPRKFTRPWFAWADTLFANSSLNCLPAVPSCSPGVCFEDASGRHVLGKRKRLTKDAACRRCVSSSNN